MSGFYTAGVQLAPFSGEELFLMSGFYTAGGRLARLTRKGRYLASWCC